MTRFVITVALLIIVTACAKSNNSEKTNPSMTNNDLAPPTASTIENPPMDGRMPLDLRPPT